MDLDDLKATWQAYEQKLDSTERVSRQLLAIVLRNRSNSTIEAMIRELRWASAILVAIVLLFAAIIAGNAFDYTRPLHYVPAVAYLLIAGTGLYFVKRHDTVLRRTTLPTHDLYHALQNLIRLRIRHTKWMERIWMLGMLAGSTIMLPNIARQFVKEGSWTSGLLVALLPVGITAVSVGLARLAGLFTDRHVNELRRQIEELEELR